MKNTLLFFALLLCLTAAAQESYPYKRPILMLDKTVTIKSNSFTEKYHFFSDFYSDPDLRKDYKKVDLGTPDTELLGREFTVIAVDSTYWEPVKRYDYKFTLKDAKNEVIYYRFVRNSTPYDYFPFTVAGGLDLPAGFYCDYIEKVKYSSDPDEYHAYIDDGMFFNREMNYDKQIKYGMSFAIYSDYEAKGIINEISLIMENGKTIKQPQSTFAKYSTHNLSKYEFSMIFDKKEMELIMNNKVLGIKIKDKVIPFKHGQKLLDVSKCMYNMPLAKK
jgi:hypothetical protein